MRCLWKTAIPGGLLCLLALLPVAAQSSACPAIVQAALASADAACSAIGRNQVCYGNTTLQADPQAGVEDLDFRQPGDVASVANIKTLTLSPLDPIEDVWGVALMKIQANLPDTLPGQNITFVLFGNVQIENAVPVTTQPVTLSITPRSRVNARSGPSTSSAIAGSLTSGQSYVVDGRNAKGDWLRVGLDDSTLAWVSAPLVIANGDITTLAEVAADTAPPLRPMQAFYFRTGTDDAPCPEAPDSGILIQTPQGAGKVTFIANGVSLSLGSTVYVQAHPGGLMTINVLEGGVKVSLYSTVFVPAGSRVQIQLDQNLLPVAGPSTVQPYNDRAFRALPFHLLPQVVAVIPPLASADIPAASKVVEAGFPQPRVSPLANSGCSKAGVTETTATFVNSSPRLVSAIWISYNCHEVLYKIVPPHKSYVQPTFATHPWIVRDTITGELLAGPITSVKGEQITVTVSG